MTDRAPTGPSPADPSDARAEDPTGTPLAWRILALAFLGGGASLGVAAGRWRPARRIVELIAALALGSVVPLALASRRPPLEPPADTGESDAARCRRGPDEPPGGPAPRPTFTVLVAGRDEAAVLPQLIADVAAQDLRGPDGEPCFELVVVDDRSIDGTGDAVAAAADRHGIRAVTRVIRREGALLADGKGAALTAAPPEGCAGDVIVVLDADARIGPAFLRTLGGCFAAGAEALTARRRVLPGDGSALARAQADEQTLDGVLQRGRWALGGCSEFRGNGIVIRRDLLAAVGGWRAAALTEDLDLASRIAIARGVRVGWVLDAEVWEQPVGSWSALWRQRLRWAEGALRRTFEHGRRQVTSPALPLAARLDFAAYAGQLIVPPTILGAVGGALTGGSRGPAALIVGAYLGAGTALAWDGLRWESRRDGAALAPAERAGRAIRAGLFNGIWLAALPGGLWRLATRRGAVGYEKMDHVGGMGG